MLEGNILITGGAGTLGRAIIKRATEEEWPCKITIFSRDAVKHSFVKKMWPHVDTVVGNIEDYNALYNTMAGMDIVIHAAAVKFIDVSEYQSIDTFQINVIGSVNVCAAAVQLNVKHVLGISTDKACHPHNAYGATKMLMEKAFQEYARMNTLTSFHLVRYGNVLESTGSVVEAWRNAKERGEPIKITDPAMTRFFISPSQAVQYVIDALLYRSGCIYVPKMKALMIGTLADYVVGECKRIGIPVRPGEKLHETLVTVDEMKFAHETEDYYVLGMSTDPIEGNGYQEPEHEQYHTLSAGQLTKEELEELLNE